MKIKRVSVLVVMAGTAALLLSCERSTKKANSKLPPTSETDPLAQPKSLQQVGVPVEMTRAAIPADNPQTPEKISLGQKLFFDRRLSADGIVSCSTCHDPALAFRDAARALGPKPPRPLRPGRLVL
jgi:cytochrome c peroxidase